MSTGSIAHNLARVRERVDRAAERAGRSPDEITLVAVSKRVGPEGIREALACGVTDLGESRIQETMERWEALEGAPRLHLVGHLQTNKAGRAVEMYHLLHSVDSARLATAVDRRAGAIDKRQDILIEVNTTGEASKHGVTPDGFGELLDQVAPLSNVRFRGLMTIGPIEGGEAAARRAFVSLRELFEVARAGWSDPAAVDVLSMGMSGDFEIAIEEGATHVRVGTAIFGPRDARAVPAAGGRGA